jgi:peptide/nickel transport system substrate-binding protein
VRSYSLVRRTQGVPHVPFIERIVLKYYPDIEEAVNAFKNRNGDGLALLPPSALAGTLKIRRELQHYRLRLPQYIAIFFNVKENAALDNARVRKALSLAVDRQRIIAEVLQGEGMRIESPFVPGSLGYDAYASTTSFDLAAAGALLDQEGWTLPEGEAVRMQGKAKQPLAVTLTTIGQPEQFTTAELVQRDWQALGVKVDLQIVDPENIFDLVRPRAYQALLVSEITGVDPDPYPFWHSSGLGEQGLNLANFSEREADILLEDARKTNDRGVREEKYRAFQRILYRETPAIFLSAPLPAYTVDKKVRGITLGGLANPSDRFAHVEQWYIETEWKLR